jgi:hypothetical protein
LVQFLQEENGTKWLRIDRRRVRRCCAPRSERRRFVLSVQGINAALRYHCSIAPSPTTPSSLPLVQQSSASSTPCLTFEDVLAKMSSSTALVMSPQPGWGADCVHWVDDTNTKSDDGKWSSTIEWENTGLFSFGAQDCDNSLPLGYKGMFSISNNAIFVLINNLSNGEKKEIPIVSLVPHDAGELLEKVKWSNDFIYMLTEITGWSSQDKLQGKIGFYQQNVGSCLQLGSAALFTIDTTNWQITSAWVPDSSLCNSRN